MFPIETMNRIGRKPSWLGKKLQIALSSAFAGCGIAAASPVIHACAMPTYSADYQFEGAVTGSIHQALSAPTATQYEFVSEHVVGTWHQRQFQPLEYNNLTNHIHVQFEANQGKIRVSHSGITDANLVYQPDALDSLTMPLALQQALIAQPAAKTDTLNVVILSAHHHAAILPIQFVRAPLAPVQTPFGRLEAIELSTQYWVDDHQIATQYWFAPSLHHVLIKSATQIDGKPVAVAALTHYQPENGCLGG
jgi:hypothetical protein